MFRTIITPKETSLTIELPEELIGKPIEVLAFEIDNEVKEKIRTKPSTKEIKEFYSQYQVNMTDFKFNRAEANER